jgi:uncharacterized RDD family membrane protein YckC
MSLLERASEPRDWVRPEALNVAPELVGQPLAKPARRLWAMGIDLAVVGLLAGVSGLWLIVGLALVALQLRSQGDPAKAQRRLVVGWVGAALIGLLVLHEAKTRWDDRQHPTVVELDEDEARPASRAASSAMLAASGAVTLTEAQRIQQLEAELAKLRDAKPTGWRADLKNLLDAFGDAYGWGIVYFSLLPAWWGGQTVGKKLFGLQVVELTGKPMTVMRNLKRYGGYAAGMATGGLGLVQLLWDDNRQAIQDKTAHTVVLDLRAPPHPALNPPAPLQNASSTSSSQ